MIKAVIFDMDGILIDSEPLWKKALIHTFSSVGIELTVELCNITMGCRSDEVINYWYLRQPWLNKSKEIVHQELLDRVLFEIGKEGVIMEGVLESLLYLKSKNIPTALASSSPFKIINKVLEILDLREFFKVIESAEHLEYGKPHPAVFIKAAQRLQEDPTLCLVVEDSLNGVLAGKAAKMKVMAIPDDLSSKDPRFIIADCKIKSLKDFVENFQILEGKN